MLDFADPISHPLFTTLVLAAAAAALLLPRLKRRLELSLAKHPSLAGHARMARRVAAQIPFYEYNGGHIFSADGAPPAIAAQRHAAFFALAGLYRERFAETAHLSAAAEAGISDLQFTSAYHVPFQFSRFVRSHLKAGVFASSASRVTVTDLDGNRLIDLAGSYGVNVFGVDFYKSCMRIAESRAHLTSEDECGRLFIKQLRGPKLLWSAVEVVNGTPEPDGTYRRYYLQVPARLRWTAREAVAWTYGLSADEYKVTVRT